MADTKKPTAPDVHADTAAAPTVPTDGDPTPDEPGKPADQSQPATPPVGTGTPEPGDVQVPDATGAAPEDPQAVVDAVNEKVAVSQNAHRIQRIDRLLMGVVLTKADAEAIGEVIAAHLSPEDRAELFGE